VSSGVDVAAAVALLDDFGEFLHVAPPPGVIGAKVLVLNWLGPDLWYIDQLNAKARREVRRAFVSTYYLNYMGLTKTSMPTIFGYFVGVSCCGDWRKYGKNILDESMPDN
jgi:hypothetical protein